MSIYLLDTTLVVTAFDVWLNDLLHHGLYSAAKPKVKSILKKGLSERWSQLPRLTGGPDLPDKKDLEAAIDVRDEIVHFLQRPFGGGNRLPPWLEDLQERGLFITGPKPPLADYTLGQKLLSYRLAHWCCVVVGTAAKNLAAGLGDPKASLVSSEANQTADVFQFYREIDPYEYE